MGWNDNGEKTSANRAYARRLRGCLVDTRFTIGGLNILQQEGQ